MRARRDPRPDGHRRPAGVRRGRHEDRGLPHGGREGVRGGVRVRRRDGHRRRHGEARGGASRGHGRRKAPWRRRWRPWWGPSSRSPRRTPRSRWAACAPTRSRGRGWRFPSRRAGSRCARRGSSPRAGSVPGLPRRVEGVLRPVAAARPGRASRGSVDGLGAAAHPGGGVPGGAGGDARRAAGTGAGRRRRPPCSSRSSTRSAGFPQWEVPAEAISRVRNGRLSGPWLVERAAAERGDLALLVTSRREPLAIVGRDPTGLWKIVRGI